jgi:hypothetical protein
MFAIIFLLANVVLTPIVLNVTPCDMVNSTGFSKGIFTEFTHECSWWYHSQEYKCRSCVKWVYEIKTWGTLDTKL